MRRRFIQVDGDLVEVSLNYVPEPRADHHIIPDIEPFKANDGAVIRGRAHWRDHLKQTGSVELGHSDIKYQGAKWEKRKEVQANRLRGPAAASVRAVDVPIDFTPAAPSRLQIELANRLHGRPTPPRKEFIKLALEQSKRLKNG